MKRILYIHHAGGIGGAPMSLLYIINQLDRSHYEPVLLALEDGPAIDLFREAGIETHIAQWATDFSHTTLEWYGEHNLWRLPGKLFGILPSILELRQHIRAIKPDIVHLNSSTLASGAIASTLERVPVVWHIREPLHRGYLGLRRGWLRWVAHHFADRIIAICQNDAEHIASVGSEKVHVVYNFVHLDVFDRSLSGACIREEFGIAPGELVVTMLGGVSEPKGTLTLIEGLPYLMERFPTIRVLIAGKPPRPLNEGGIKGIAKQLLRVDAYQKQVMRALDAIPTRERVTFTGIRLDMPEVIAASDVIVFPSSVEHFARPLIEAAAMATPGVASDLGGPREIIVHGETGLLVNPNEPRALAEGIATILEDAHLAQAMGEAGYERAVRLFEAKKNTEATVRVYDEIWNEAQP